MNPAIQLQGVRKSFESGFALGPLDLTVPQGAIYGLIGPNGAGKTTTLNFLIGAVYPDHGQVEVLGLPWSRHEAEIKRRLGFVSPALDYAAWGSVGNAINFVRGFYPDWDETYAEWLQMQLGIHRGDRVAELSFGGRTKLSLILALSRRCDLLVLDEPTVGLDALSRRLIFTELLRFMEREDHTILISSHQLSDIERFADHLAVLNAGHLLSAGRTDQLIERYRLVDVGPARGRLHTLKGAAVVRQEGERAQLLLDMAVMPQEALHSSGLEVFANSAVTLEELFLAMIRSDSNTRPWRPG